MAGSALYLSGSRSDLDAWPGTTIANSPRPGWPRSGTGRFAEFLARSGHQVIGVDSSQDMLAHSRRRVPDGEFHVAELDRLPLPDDSADVIV